MDHAAAGTDLLLLAGAPIRQLRGIMVHRKENQSGNNYCNAPERLIFLTNSTLPASRRLAGSHLPVLSPAQNSEGQRRWKALASCHPGNKSGWRMLLLLHAGSVSCWQVIRIWRTWHFTIYPCGCHGYGAWVLDKENIAFIFNLCWNTEERRDKKHNWRSKNENQAISYSMKVFL